MDIWQLTVFCKVVESKSFSRAAADIHLSQPTVSSHIKDLETYFGCRLIDRLSKEVVPTKAGELLYRDAIRLLALRDEIEQTMADFLGKIKGKLAIGGSTLPGVYLLPKYIGKFIKQYPEVVISLSIGDTEKILKDIISGKTEIGIVGAISDDHQFIQENLMEDELKLVVPSDHPWADRQFIELEMLFDEPFIIREPGSGTLKTISQHLEKKGYGLDCLKICAEMGSTGAVCEGIKNRIGISIISTLAVKDEIHSGILKALSIRGLRLKRNFYLTRLRLRTPSPSCRVFGEFLLNAFKSEKVK